MGGIADASTQLSCSRSINEAGCLEKRAGSARDWGLKRPKRPDNPYVVRVHGVDISMRLSVSTLSTLGTENGST